MKKPERISEGIPGQIPEKVHGGILEEYFLKYHRRILWENHWRLSHWYSLRNSLQIFLEEFLELNLRKIHGRISGGNSRQSF